MTLHVRGWLLCELRSLILCLWRRAALKLSARSVPPVCCYPCTMCDFRRLHHLAMLLQIKLHGEKTQRHIKHPFNKFMLVHHQTGNETKPKSQGKIDGLPFLLFLSARGAQTVLSCFKMTWLSERYGCTAPCTPLCTPLAPAQHCMSSEAAGCTAPMVQEKQGAKRWEMQRQKGHFMILWLWSKTVLKYNIQKQEASSIWHINTFPSNVTTTQTKLPLLEKPKSISCFSMCAAGVGQAKLQSLCFMHRIASVPCKSKEQISRFQSAFCVYLLL